MTTTPKISELRIPITIYNKDRLEDIRRFLDSIDIDFGMIHPKPIPQPAEHAPKEHRDPPQHRRHHRGALQDYLLKILDDVYPKSIYYKDKRIDASIVGKSQNSVISAFCSLCKGRLAERVGGGTYRRYKRHDGQTQSESIQPQESDNRVGRRPYSKNDLVSIKWHSDHKTPLRDIAGELKRSAGAIRQKALTMGLPMGHRRK
jgi:hypothetical protein